MRPSYFALLAIVLVLGWQARGLGQTPPTPPPSAAASDPAALALIDGAIQKLTRPEGVDVRYRLEVFGSTQPVVTTGRSVTAAHRKVYAELTTRQVARGGTMKMLCDGETFYRIEVVEGKNNIASYSLKDLQQALDRLATTESERVAKEDVEREQQGRHGFEGAAAIVKDLKARMVFSAPQTTTTTVAGKAVGVKIVQGEWAKDVLDLIAPPKQGDNPNAPDARKVWNEKDVYFNMPRLARFYFDLTTNDLRRIELVGIREKQGPESILTVMHYDSITPLTKLDEYLFKPTAAELAYTKIEVNLAEYIRSEHQQMMARLKQLQDMQNQGAIK